MKLGALAPAASRAFTLAAAATATMTVTATALATAALATGCKLDDTSAQKDTASAAAPASPAASSTPAADPSALHLGAPIDAAVPRVALAELAKNPSAYAGKTFTTEGTVSAVCQHMGCWMEIKDDVSQAHIKMAGHRFFVPKTSAGHRARVLASLSASDAPTCSDEGDCNPAKTNGNASPNAALSKVELVADGVELM